MLGSDVVVSELERLAKRQLEDLLGPGGEWDVTAGRRAALANDFFNLIADRFERDAEGFECFRSHTLALVNESQQDVLSADVVVVEETCFLLSQYNNSASSIGKSLEQRSSPCDLWCTKSNRRVGQATFDWDSPVCYMQRW